MTASQLPASTLPVTAVVMGVSGAGKSAVGVRLAARFGAAFIDGDDLHPPENIAKMAAGHPLDDADRRPWLLAVGRWLREHRAEGAIAACSALKRSYRDLLRQACPGVVFIHLAGGRDLIIERVAARQHHFMPAGLVDSQFATLEPLGADEQGITLDVTGPVQEVAGRAAAWLTERPAG
ncbi:MAG: gluconokinase [Acidipropionibacterium sp.]|jgi:gluconokinase|nr:gluconokinase [Acidipropionibacterium sp.]